MARDWCFTSFDTDKELGFEKDNCRYIIYGRERCPTTNREHYQGFAIFKRTCRMPKAKQWLGGQNGVHLDPRRGTRDEARDYCIKDGDVFEWGVFDGITKEDLFNKPIGFIKENYKEFYCRYHKGLEKLQPKGDKWRKVEVIHIQGEPGTGKTRMVMEMDSVYKIDAPYKWFDGYEGEEILLIDDYKRGMIDRGLFLNLLDGYRLRLETKGSHTWALWSKVYITSNYDTASWDAAELRRVTSFIRRDGVTGLLGNTDQ